MTVTVMMVGPSFNTVGLVPFGVNVPEPSACGLLVFGLVTFLAARRR